MAFHTEQQLRQQQAQHEEYLRQLALSHQRFAERQMFEAIYHPQQIVTSASTSGGGGRTEEPISLIFDITANWTLTSPAVVDSESFKTFLESGDDNDGNTNNLTDVVVTNFLLEGSRLTCNLSASGDGADLVLANIAVTSVVSFGNISGSLSQLRLNSNSIASIDTIVWPDVNGEIDLGGNAITSVDNITWPSGLRFLYLNDNQIVTFNPTQSLPNELEELKLSNNQIVTFNPNIALPNSLEYLYLANNQMTTAGYIASEPWANAMSVIPARGEIIIGGNIDTPDELKTILIDKGWTVTV